MKMVEDPISAVKFTTLIQPNYFTLNNFWGTPAITKAFDNQNRKFEEFLMIFTIGIQRSKLSETVEISAVCRPQLAFHSWFCFN